MPILKPITGYTRCGKIKRYLERDGRALASDFFNFDWCMEKGSSGAMMPEGFNWAKEMDRTRHYFGNDTPYRGMSARTFKHYVLSPPPSDKVTLDELRELTKEWVAKYFSHYEVAIIYHDDNDQNIPHAHIVVNNTNLLTGQRLHIDDPLFLNRDLQAMAKARGFSFLENEDANESKGKPPTTQKTRYQAIHKSKAEQRIVKEGGYSWLADLRHRVMVAKTLSRDEGEFKRALDDLGISLSESANSRKRPDWVFSFSEWPARRATGMKLGYLLSKDAITRSFDGVHTFTLSENDREQIDNMIHSAIELKDLAELHRFAQCLEVFERFDVFGTVAASQKIQKLQVLSKRAPDSLRKSYSTKVEQLTEAMEYLEAKGLLHEVDGKAGLALPARQVREYGSPNSLKSGKTSTIEKPYLQRKDLDGLSSDKLVDRKRDR